MPASRSVKSSRDPAICPLRLGVVEDMGAVAFVAEMTDAESAIMVEAAHYAARVKNLSTGQHTRAGHVFVECQHAVALKLHTAFASFAEAAGRQPEGLQAKESRTAAETACWPAAR